MIAARVAAVLDPVLEELKATKAETASAEKEQRWQSRVDGDQSQTAGAEEDANNMVAFVVFVLRSTPRFSATSS